LKLNHNVVEISIIFSDWIEFELKNHEFIYKQTYENASKLM